MTALRRGAAAGAEVSLAPGFVLDESFIRNGGSLSPKSLMIPTLTFISGGAPGTEIPILKQQLVIGRGEETDIPIADPSISRRHAQLCCRRVLGQEGGSSFRVVLRDLESTSGTLVNCRRVQRAVLKRGDRVFVGKAVLEFSYRDLADQDFYSRIYRLATTDPLTLLLNQATIARRLEDEIAKCARCARPLSVLRIDLDDFASLNDLFGRTAADHVLRAAGRILRRSLRRQDSAGCLEGEELLVIQPETHSKGAAAAAERIRGEIERIVAPSLRLERPVTASIGVATISGTAAPGDGVLERADCALFRAKAKGKNRVEIWKASPAGPPAG